MRPLLLLLACLAAAPIAADPLLLWRPAISSSDNLLQGFAGRVSSSEVRQRCAQYPGADLWIYQPQANTCGDRPVNRAQLNRWLGIDVVGMAGSVSQALETSPVWVWPERRLACLPGTCPLAGSATPEFPPEGFSPPPPVSINSFTASSLSIVAGEGTTLSWTAAGVSVCQLGPQGQTASVAASGSQTVTPAQTTIYELNCSGAGGSDSAQLLITVTPPPEAPAIQSFAASPSNILAGNSSLLTWISSNASTCAIVDVADNLRRSGSILVKPTTTRTYRLLCSGSGGVAERIRKVTVTPADMPVAIDQFAASPTSLRQGQSTTLKWKSRNADTCEIASVNRRWRVKVAVNGSYRLAPGETDTYRLTCRNAVSKEAQSLEVTVLPVSGKVRLPTFSVTRSRLLAGSQVQLDWDSDLATSCGLRRDTGQYTSVPPDGSALVQVDETTTFTASCVSSAGQATASQTVEVVDEVVFVAGLEGD